MLLIKQREDGTKLDSIVITTQPEVDSGNRLLAMLKTGPSTAGMSSTRIPAGALISNLYEERS